MTLNVCGSNISHTGIPELGANEISTANKTPNILVGIVINFFKDL